MIYCIEFKTHLGSRKYKKVYCSIRFYLPTVYMILTPLQSGLAQTGVGNKHLTSMKFFEKLKTGQIEKVSSLFLGLGLQNPSAG